MRRDDGYLLGHADQETQRLIRQGALAEHDTEALMRDAGLGPGMHVLDIGTGLGDVAILAGRLVRPGGRVLGIERSTESIALAQQRVAAIASVDVRFEVVDLDTYEPRQKFDALVGRFVLSYLKDPSATLRRLSRHVRTGGIIAMMEFDNRVLPVSGRSLLFQRVINWIVGAFEGSGVDPSLGSDLARIFHDAGLPWPRMKSVRHTAGGPEGPLWFYADLLRTLLPQIERLGLATVEEVDVETIADRLRAEAETEKLTVFLPRWTGAWVQKPS
jgi:SAM-dependent methyltransferase